MAQPISVFSGLCKINNLRPHGNKQIIGRLSADADNGPMPIVKWPIPIIGKLVDNQPIPIIGR